MSFTAISTKRFIFQIFLFNRSKLEANPPVDPGVKDPTQTRVCGRGYPPPTRTPISSGSIFYTYICRRDLFLTYFYLRENRLCFRSTPRCPSSSGLLHPKPLTRKGEDFILSNRERSPWRVYTLTLHPPARTLPCTSAPPRQLRSAV